MCEDNYQKVEHL